MADIGSNNERILIYHDNQYKSYNSDTEEWDIITITGVYSPSETEYIDYGMTYSDIQDIPETAWAELDGEVEISLYTSEPRKSIVFAIETDPFYVEDLLEDEYVVSEYVISDDGNFPERGGIPTCSLITLPTKMNDLLDEEFEVVYSTIDEYKETVNLNLVSEYSPLDELESDIEILHWSEDNEEKFVHEKILTNQVSIVNEGSVYETTVNIDDDIEGLFGSEK